MKKTIYILLFLGLPFIILIPFRVFPLIFTVILSLYKWGMGGPESFVGLGNFLSLINDEKFYKAFINTIYYVVFLVPLEIMLSLFFAYLIHKTERGKYLFRSIFYLPVVTSVVASSVVWKWMFHPNIGIANLFIRALGGRGLKWLHESKGIFEMLFNTHLPYIFKGPSVALFSLVIMGVWHGLGYNIIIYLAGLNNINPTYYEAAKIDGARTWTRFWRITWPLLMPTTFYVLIVTIISSFNIFAPIWIMTSPAGGPLGTTRTVMYYFYEKSFEEWQMGSGAALALISFLFILILTYIQKKVIEPKIHYG